MTDESNRPARRPSHRRRALVGLVLASALAAALLYSIHGAVRTANERAAVERVAVVHARALAELVERIGDQGDSVRAVVRRWAEEHPGIRAIRVVRIAGILLEASTAPQDHGERAPPRRLDREEKDYYDQAQRLRAAEETNRQEGVSRKEEIEVRAGSEGFTVAVPLTEEGAVAGMVALEIAPEPARSAGVPVAPLLAFRLPVVLFLILSPVVGDRRLPAFAAAAALLLGAAGVYGVISIRDMLRTRAAAAASAGAAVSRDAALAASLMGPVGAPGVAPLRPDA